MFKFAHMADVHIGAHDDKRLIELEKEAFYESIDICVRKKVDFIIIAGDFFDDPIPKNEIVKNVILKLRELKEKSNIPVYVLYGSHDYIRGGTSMIDLLDAAGLIVKISDYKNIKEDNQGKKILNIIKDDKTGTKLVGISARKNGAEKEYFEKLNVEYLEKQDGFKIFVFHSGIQELLEHAPFAKECVPIEWFPKGFNYYAGGHIHQNKEEYNMKAKGYENIIIPGPLFIGWGSRDYEDVSNGEKRGFYIVSCEENKVMENGIEFIKTDKLQGKHMPFNVTRRSAEQANDEIIEEINNLKVEDDTLITVRISGELSSGKPSDIDDWEFQKLLAEKGTIDPIFLTPKVTTKEYQKIQVTNEDKTKIEEELLEKNIINVKSKDEMLKEEKGVNLANELLKLLKTQSKKDGVIESALTLFGISKSNEE